MSITKFKGQPVQIAGEFVKAGAAAPDFELVKTDLSTLSLKDLRGKQVILIFGKNWMVNITMIIPMMPAGVPAW